MPRRRTPPFRDGLPPTTADRSHERPAIENDSGDLQQIVDVQVWSFSETTKQFRVATGDVESQFTHTRPVTAVLHVALNSDEDGGIHRPVLLLRERFELLVELIGKIQRGNYMLIICLSSAPDQAMP